MSDQLESQKSQDSETNPSLVNINQLSQSQDDDKNSSQIGDWYILRNNNHIKPIYPEKNP